ncbi:hypothetical protein [Salinibacter altiplanensis]|uniref:hypothetical protein n=1 Tax=Salinibacter altiplanensis TaxID=1803181 RepID=UPI000C9F471C|nr:hypothetical protein [Salinibacter altiplanensis]
MQSISAAVHIQGSTIRYAEIERDGSDLDLRRCGEEAFEVDVARVLWGEERPEALDEIAAALARIFDDADTSAVGLVVHPQDAYSFFMPLPEGLSPDERDRRVAYQAALVTNTRSPSALHTVSKSVRTTTEKGESIEWVHVLAVPQQVKARTDALFAEVAAEETTGRVLSAEAAAHLMGPFEEGGALVAPADGEETYRLAIGQYADHTEYALTRGGRWHHAHAAQDAPTAADQAYYAAGVLNRIGAAPDALDALVVYGADADAVTDEPFKSVFGCTPAVLDPFEQLHRTWEPDAEKPGEYVPCIGGALALSVQ